MSEDFIPGLEKGTDDLGRIACDLTDVKEIEILQDEEHKGSDMKRSDISDFGDQGFLLHDVLTEKECRYFIEQGEKIGFAEIYGAQENYRNSTRINLRSPELAAALWERVKSHVTEITIDGDPNHHHVQGISVLLQGTWKPVGLNEIFRFCHYNPGGHFAPHYDGHFVRNSHERSLKTFMLYLNDSFSCGTTNFINDQQPLYKDVSGKYCAEDKNILCRVKPEPGMAIIFNHHRLHEGEQVIDGEKYILRTDIMFQNTTPDKLSKADEEALQLVQEAERREACGEAMKAAEMYRKAFKMSPSIAESYGS